MIPGIYFSLTRMLRLSSGLFLHASSVQVQAHFLFLSLRHWQEQAASADTKLQTLTSRLNELRERFKQAQRDIETHEV
jgi:hypothetical protein